MSEMFFESIDYVSLIPITVVDTKYHTKYFVNIAQTVVVSCTLSINKDKLSIRPK